MCYHLLGQSRSLQHSYDLIATVIMILFRCLRHTVKFSVATSCSALDRLVHGLLNLLSFFNLSLRRSFTVCSQSQHGVKSGILSHFQSRPWLLRFLIVLNDLFEVNS